MNRGQERNLYYFRDKQGLEVDFVVDSGNRNLILLEAKATRTPRPEDARPLARLASAVKSYRIAAHLVHLPAPEGLAAQVLRPGVTTIAWNALGSILGD